MFALRMRRVSRRGALMATTAATVMFGFGTAHAGVPITGVKQQSDVGTTVDPDFQGGTLQDNQNNATDNHGYVVEDFPANTIDADGHKTTFAGNFTGAGGLTITDSVGGGNVVFGAVGILGGTVLIDGGATATWGDGTNPAFLIGPGNAVTDNGLLVMDFGAGNVLAGQVPISGTGAVDVHSGTFDQLGASTYTGGTTIDAGATLQLGDGVAGEDGTVAGDIVNNGALEFNYAGAATTPGVISGAGSVEVQAGTAVFTGQSPTGGTVTIDSGATMQWGAGGVGFLVGLGNAVTDNGALVANFGGGGIGGLIPISGTGTLEVQSGILNDSGVSTLSGATTIDAGGALGLAGAGSFASSDVIDDGVLDVSGGTGGNSIKSLDGGGSVSVGANTLTLDDASGVFSGVIQDAGAFAGSGGGLTIAGGTEVLSGTNTFTGTTTIDVGATLELGFGGTTGSVAGAIVDNGVLLFNYGGAVTTPGNISGTGDAEVTFGTAVVTGLDTIGGTVTIDPGATLQWGAGGVGFLVGG
ncbi:MAG TPA: hypothetical protein VGG29_08240, partial [Caulobacteraceae bacterium]